MYLLIRASKQILPLSPTDRPTWADQTSEQNQNSRDHSWFIVRFILLMEAAKVGLKILHAVLNAIRLPSSCSCPSACKRSALKCGRSQARSKNWLKLARPQMGCHGRGTQNAEKLPSARALTAAYGASGAGSNPMGVRDSA